MTPRELQAALSGLGWSSGELARRLGVHPNSVSGWKGVKRDIPPYVPEYLRVVSLAKAILDQP